MSYEMNDLLEIVVEQHASDLHLQVGQAPTLRLSGSMTPVDGPALTPMDTENLMLAITPDTHVQNVKLNGGTDFGFAYLDKARFRVSVLKAKGNFGLVLRQIPNKMFGLREIGLPDKVKELLFRPRGLIVVTGPTGSGKSTTLASMINYINENREGHIITIEDPIEYYHDHKRCIVTQREIGVDVPNFSEAIRRALRQDPDVILVGEMRDLETIEAAISAAETGHLVFATLHTNGAAKTIDRIVDAFPSNMKDMIRTQLASSIQAVLSQVLCKKIGGGRIAAFEIMINTTSIASLIRENKTFRINSDIQTGAIARHDHARHPPHEPREPGTRVGGRGIGQGAGSRGHAREAPPDGLQAAGTVGPAQRSAAPAGAVRGAAGFSTVTSPMYEGHDQAVAALLREAGCVSPAMLSRLTRRMRQPQCLAGRRAGCPRAAGSHGNAPPHRGAPRIALPRGTAAGSSAGSRRSGAG